MSIPGLLATKLAQTETHLRAYYSDFIAQRVISDERLQNAIDYALFNGGKRMRPLLVMLVGEMLSLDEKVLTPLALGIECIHAYSLVHDDLPAMDDDDLRRGKPTCHIKFDEATAILAGDALQSLAFEIVASAMYEDIKSPQTLQLVALLSHAAGPFGMVGGQSLDLAATNQHISLSELTNLHALKTGALLSASVQMPCIICNQLSQQDNNNLTTFAKSIGLAFQIQDDILDVTADTKTLGKPQGSDQQANKSTFVSLLGLEGAKTELQKQHTAAINALMSLKYDTNKLQIFTDYMVSRTY